MQRAKTKRSTIKISKIRAREILDSRGNPTVEVAILLSDGEKVKASVPSGASVGSHEALELRDGDEGRFAGMGVLKAVANVNEVIGPKLAGRDPRKQEVVDNLLCELDGTSNKSKLGANATLGVSLAAARAGAHASGKKLYEYLSDCAGILKPNFRMPHLMMNLINGGKHSDAGLDIQEFMVIPATMSVWDAVRIGVEIDRQLRNIVGAHGFPVAVADEGGYAPRLHSNVQAIDFILTAAHHAGFRPYDDFTLALDVAATTLYGNETYVFQKEKLDVPAQALVTWYEELVQRYPISSIEDGMAEDDWQGWKLMTNKLKAKVLLVGDDLFVTSATAVKHGFKERVAGAVIIKPNQIGTLTETLACIREARRAGYAIVVSHRSGETCDDFIADLAVGAGADFLKAGAPVRGERVAKYNRLLEIEGELQKISNF
jgi:enolase